MTKDELWKIIESQSWDDKAEIILKNAVERYTEALLKKCNVMSRFSRDKLIELINEIVESKQTLGAEDIADAIIAAKL